MYDRQSSVPSLEYVKVNNEIIYVMEELTLGSQRPTEIDTSH